MAELKNSQAGTKKVEEWLREMLQTWVQIHLHHWLLMGLLYLSFLICQMQHPCHEIIVKIELIYSQFLKHNKYLINVNY